MRIVVLDGYAANPGDLSWADLQEMGECIVYDRTSPEEVIIRSLGADILLTNKTPLMDDTLANLPGLKYIGVLATGYNVVDVEAASRLGIVVTNIPAYSTDSVAQMVFAHLLNITQRVGHYAHENRNGRWSRNTDFCYWDTPLIELAGKSIGIVGLGNTGMATARIALAFGMKVLAYTSKSMSQLPEGILPCTLEELFTRSDVISLHCPLTTTTRELVNAERLAMMKPTAIIINTGRGPLVNERHLADALNNGTIFAAGIDVLVEEPARDDNPLITAKNCFITPHIAWATDEARKRLMNIAIDNIRSFIKGEIHNQVNP